MVEVQIATGDDVGAVVELERCLFAEDSGAHERYADVGWPARDGEPDVADLPADAIALLARAGDETVGLLMAYATVVGATRQPIRSAVLRSTYVTTSHRRSGVAGALIAEFLDWARRTDCVESRVDHYVADTAASDLYESFGFAAHSLNRVLHL